MVSKSLTKGLGIKRNRVGCLELGNKGGGRRGWLEPEKKGRVRRWPEGEEMCTGSGPPHGWRGKEGPAPEWTAAVGFRSDLAMASRARENEKGQRWRRGRDGGRGRREGEAATIPTPAGVVGLRGRPGRSARRRFPLSNPLSHGRGRKELTKRFVLREGGNSGEIGGPSLCISAMGGRVRAKTLAYSFLFWWVVSEYIQTSVLGSAHYQIQFNSPIRTRLFGQFNNPLKRKRNGNVCIWPRLFGCSYWAVESDLIMG